MDEKQGIAFVRGVLTTFGDATLVGNISMENSRLQLEQKGLMGTKVISSGENFMSLSIGEYNLIHAGIGNIIIALLDANEGLDLKKLSMQTGDQIIDLTEGYYFDFLTEKPKPYLYSLVKKTIKKMVNYQLVDIRNGKYYRAPCDSVDFISSFYGQALNNPNGISSFYRMMVISIIGVEGGIGADFVPQRLREIHGIENLKNYHLDKVLNIHGSQGTGYILQDVGGRLWRMYERLEQHPNSSPSILQTNEELMKLIMRTPCISHNQIYEIFGPEIAKQLYAETQEIQPCFAKSIVVRRGDMYITGAFAKALHLRNCEPEKNPALSLVRDLYAQFSPQDCASVAFYARDLLHELHTKGQVKPQNDKERRILLFLMKRKLVETETLENDTYIPSNKPLIKQLSIVIGNILD